MFTGSNNAAVLYIDDALVLRAVLDQYRMMPIMREEND